MRMKCSEQRMAEMADLFEADRTRLRRLAAFRMPPALARRVSLDDLLQETWLAAVRRVDHFFAAPEIPAFVRFRTLLLQTLTDLARRHLACQKRDAAREVDFDAADDNGGITRTSLGERWNTLADTVTSPRTRLAKEEHFALVRNMLASLSASERQIIEMRNFEEMSNLECAAALGIEPKAASIRYVRALKRCREKLVELPEFRR